MKQINLFIVGTAYQFISAYTICAEEYSSSDFENHIYFMKSDRTAYELTYSTEEFNGKIVRFQQNDFIELIAKLKNEVFHRFFFFQEDDIFNKYLAYHLKRNGAIICLGPDGTKPYGVFNKNHEFLSMIKDTVADYKSLKNHELKLPKLIWSKYYRYGSCALLDEVWIQYPNLFNAFKNKTKAKIIQIPSLTAQHIEHLIKIFNFKNTELTKTEKIILYFNQPLFSEELINKEFEILEAIANQFPDKRIHIKLHPSTTQKVHDKMQLLPYIFLINDKLPAEFYLGMVSNSILLTGWSAALMHDVGNQNNKSYFLYPMYKNVKDKVLSQITLTSFLHIKMVDTIDQINFPNE